MNYINIEWIEHIHIHYGHYYTEKHWAHRLKTMVGFYTFEKTHFGVVHLQAK